MKDKFPEWFHAEYLRLYGPVDLEDEKSIAKHRAAKSWAKSAWTMAVLQTMRHVTQKQRECKVCQSQPREPHPPGPLYFPHIDGAAGKARESS